MKRTIVAASILLIGTIVRVSLNAAPAAPAAINITGTWRGTATDNFDKLGPNVADGMIVTWVLTQSGSAVSGTVTTTGLHPGDVSCSDCHRAKTGTVSGTVLGTALSLTMDFPGRVGEPSPTCSATFSGTAVPAQRSFTLSYSGSDSCEQTFSGGSLPVTRAFTDDVLTAGVTPIKLIHLLELRARIDGVRSAQGLAPYAYADDTLTVGASMIRAQHIIDLRNALAEAYVASGRTAPTYTDPALIGGTAIRALHIAELRTKLAGIE